jgi:hypothetical protein
MWANGIGCTCQSGYGGPNGSTFTKITAPNGKSVTVVGVGQKEKLVSSQLNYLDRRLGLQSPFDRVQDA